MQLGGSFDDDDLDTTSMPTANTDGEIPKEGLVTHVNLQDMDSIIRLCKEARMQDALMFYDEMIKKGLVPNFKTYSVLISSLGTNDKLQEANKLMKEMLVLLNHITWGRTL